MPEINEITNELETETQPVGFEVSLGTFSGPLDLLWHLVESREMDPVKLNLTELVSQYVRFLLESERTTLNEMAEFFGFASRLLLRKVGALFPARADEEAEEEAEEILYVDSEEDLFRMMEKFRPYRNAASHLADLQSRREKSFARITDEESRPFYDLGDLYGLASLWWELLSRYSERTSQGDGGDDFTWDDIPDAMPEERQVEERMEELSSLIRERKVSLRELVSEKNRKALIVTLLALLEMSRLGMVRIEQYETLGDVVVGIAVN